MILTESNFLLYAAQNYQNHSCVTTEEFVEDIKRIKYLKKLFGQYKKSAQMNERLILNHIVILYNVFAPRACTRMLFFKLEEHWDVLKPFLLAINMLPPIIDGLIEEGFIINTNAIIMSQDVADRVKLILHKGLVDETHTAPA